MNPFEGIEWPPTPLKRISEFSDEDVDLWKKYFKRLARRAKKYPDLVVVDTGSKYGVVAIFSETQRDYFENNKIRHAWSGLKFYLVTVKGNKRVLTHRDILGLNGYVDGNLVDHSSGHSTVVTPDNLDLGTYTSNSQNKPKTKRNSSSQYIGVVKTRSGKYQASIVIDKKHVNLGVFETEEEAATTRDLKAVEQKTKCRLNFPKKREEYEARLLSTRACFRVAKKVGAFKSCSGYIGVVVVNGKSIQVARSKTKRVCWKAYDKYVVENNLANRRLNYPEDYPDFVTWSSAKVRELATEITKGGYVKIIHPKFENGILVDADVYEEIKRLTITFASGYPVIMKNRAKIRLHRFVMGRDPPPEKPYVDHINKKKWDARRKNLRFVSAAENIRNQSKRHNAVSEYYGVGRGNKPGIWSSTLKFEGDHVFFGRFRNEEVAAMARDLFVMSDPKYFMSNLSFDWSEFTPEEICELRDKVERKELGAQYRARCKGVSKQKQQKSMWRMVVKFDGKPKGRSFETRSDAERAREILISTIPEDQKYRCKAEKYFNVSDKILNQWKKELRYEGYSAHFHPDGSSKGRWD